jgi:hypothetical protein
MALQKIFLLPPLKGLNLYDNPFTMSPDYAVDLVNFMPPTTTFRVRPSVKYIGDIEGQVRGIYSYMTGASISYGTDWWISTIQYGAARNLLVKTVDMNGNTSLLGIIPKENDMETNTIGKIANSYYNDDSALFKHTLFFTSGSPGSSMYLYHQAKGIKEFALKIGNQGQHEIGNMQNITIFKHYIFLSENSNLNIYFIEESKADIIDYNNSQWWKTIEGLFSPPFGGSFSLDGIVQNGGTILKLTNISKSGSDSIATYLTVITDQGEIILFDGTDPKDNTGEKWKVTGRFQISPPLNKWAFADMEGDFIVVTKNGLISLRRVIFGQSTNITENLEFRLMSLFSEYMFRIPEFIEFIGLYYHPRNRLLILNVPTAIPIPFNKIVSSYNLDENTSLVFPVNKIINDNALISEQDISNLTNFINTFCVPNYLSYYLYIELDGDYNNSCIQFLIKGYEFLDKINEKKAGIIKVALNIKLNGEITPLLDTPIDPDYNSLPIDPNFKNKHYIKYVIPNLETFSNFASLDFPSNKLYWSQSLMKKFTGEKDIFSFRFPKNTNPQSNDESFTVTNIVPSTEIFYKRTTDVTLGDIIPNKSIRSYNQIVISTYMFSVLDMVLIPPYTYCTPIDTFFIGYNNYAEIIDNFSGAESYNWSDIAPKTYGNNPDAISPSRVMLNAMVDVLERSYNGGSVTYTFETSANIEMEYESPDKKITTIKNPLTLNCKYYVYGKVQGQELDLYESNMTLTLSFKYTDPKTDPHTVTEYSIIVKCTQTKNMQNSEAGFNFYDKHVIISENLPHTISFDGFRDVTFNYDGKTKWTMNNSSFDYAEKLLERLKYYMPELENSNDWLTTYGYMFSNFLLKNNHEVTPAKKAETEYSPSYVTNVDLTLIPLLNNINIVCDFKSTQYVFDSHFGTWSSFKDINMVKGIEHDNDFYFIVPKNIEYKDSHDPKDAYLITSSMLCKFDEYQLGDYDQVKTTPETIAYKAIEVAYKTVPTFDFGVPQKKFFKRIKIFGRPSVFWQPKPNDDVSYTLIVTPYSDFKKGQAVSFIHEFDKDSISVKVLKKHFKNRRMRELSYSEQKKFLKLYAEENNEITQISMPLIANPGTRFGLLMTMEITEFNSEIYGFEIFFEPSGQIL